MDSFTDTKLEEIILSSAIHDPLLAELLQQQLGRTQHVYPIFSSDIHNAVAEIVIHYYKEHSNIPSLEVLLASQNGLASNSVLRGSIERLYKQRHNVTSDTYQTLLQRANSLAILRAAGESILQCVNNIEQDELKSLEQLSYQLDEILATRSSAESIIAGDFWSDTNWADDYLKYAANKEKFQARLSLGTLEYTIGPVAYGEMISLYGGVNQGKSFLLGHLGWDLYCHQDMHVVHVTLETSKRFVDWRYASRAIYEITGSTAIGFNDFRNATIEEKQLKWIKDFPKLLSTEGSLYVLDIPEEYATVDTLTAIIKERRKNYPTDVIIIDYATLMRLRSGGKANPYEWDVVGALSKELRDRLARGRVLKNSMNEFGTILITASQMNPQQSTKRSITSFIKNIQASDVGLSYLYSQPVDVGIHLRRERDIRNFDIVEDTTKLTSKTTYDDLLLLILTKSRNTGGLGATCWFRPDWANWILGPPLQKDEVLTSLGTGVDE